MAAGGSAAAWVPGVAASCGAGSAEVEHGAQLVAAACVGVQNRHAAVRVHHAAGARRNATGLTQRFAGNAECREPVLSFDNYFARFTIAPERGDHELPRTGGQNGT